MKQLTIFIDTSVFESENFTQGNKIKEIFNLSSRGVVQVLMPILTYKEILSRAKFNINKSIQQINSFKGKVRILRNIEKYNSLFNVNSIQEDISNIQEEAFNQFKKTFDETIKFASIEILPFLSINPEKIFDKYFNREFPFGNGKKKAEFPDAFTLEIIQSWCQKQKKSCYIISLDKDMLSYKHPSLIPTNIRKFIAIANKTLYFKEQRSIIQKAEKAFEDHKDKILQIIKDKLIGDIKYDLLQPSPGYIVKEIEFLYVDEPKISDYIIMNLGSDAAKIELDVYYSYEASILIEDRTEATYNEEYDKWEFVQEFSHFIEDNFNLFSVLSLDFIPEIEFKIDSIDYQMKCM
ncbi:MAG: PIN domain-containing protein [Aureispira sp.]